MTSVGRSADGGRPEVVRVAQVISRSWPAPSPVSPEPIARASRSTASVAEMRRPREPVERVEDRRRGQARGGRHQQDAGRRHGRGQLADPLADAFHERGAVAAREERHVGPEPQREARAGRRIEVDAPARRGQVERRGRVAAAATEPGGHRDALLEVEGRARAARVRPRCVATPGRRGRPEDEVAVDRAVRVAGDLDGIERPGSADVDREVVVEREARRTTERSVWKPSARRPVTASARFAFARAARLTRPARAPLPARSTPRR